MVQDRKISALGLHLARNFMIDRTPSRKSLWAAGCMAKTSGLQGSKPTPPPFFETLTAGEEQ